MLALELSKQAEKFLLRVPAKHAGQLVPKVQQLRDDPSPQDAAILKGYTYMRADLGEYRIIYEVVTETLLILLIGKRNDDEVYRQLKRKLN